MKIYNERGGKGLLEEKEQFPGNYLNTAQEHKMWDQLLLLDPCVKWSESLAEFLVFYILNMKFGLVLRHKQALRAMRLSFLLVLSQLQRKEIHWCLRSSHTVVISRLQKPDRNKYLQLDNSAYTANCKQRKGPRTQQNSSQPLLKSALSFLYNQADKSE